MRIVCPTAVSSATSQLSAIFGIDAVYRLRLVIVQHMELIIIGWLQLQTPKRHLNLRCASCSIPPKPKLDQKTAAGQNTASPSYYIKIHMTICGGCTKYWRALYSIQLICQFIFNQLIQHNAIAPISRSQRVLHIAGFSTFSHKCVCHLRLNSLNLCFKRVTIYKI